MPLIWRKYMPSFDVVSELDLHEVTNAIDNATKELERRYDLRGKCSMEFKDKTVWEVFQEERPALMAMRAPFDGFVEKAVRATTNSCSPKTSFPTPR